MFAECLVYHRRFESKWVGKRTSVKTIAGAKEGNYWE